MYNYVSKEGHVIKMTNQAKNAMDHTIKNNQDIKKKAKIKAQENVLSVVDKGLYDLKGGNVAMPKAPRRK